MRTLISIILLIVVLILIVRGVKSCASKVGGSFGHVDWGIESDNDWDNDGYTNNKDCNDFNAAINPDAKEVCDLLNIDENCNGLFNENDPTIDPSELSAYPADRDQDGFGDPNNIRYACEVVDTSLGDDCDDHDAAINPWALEVCDDENRDENCNGFVEANDPLLDPTTAITVYLDQDGDGYGTESRLACQMPAGYTDIAGDCNDNDPTIHPDRRERCDNGQTDEDCDGLIDDADDDLQENTRQQGYTDADGDGYGDANALVLACTLPPGVVADASDCDDADNSIGPADLWTGDVFESNLADVCLSSRCSIVTGNVTLNASTLQDLSALSCIRSIQGGLSIESNPALSSLNGLQDISTVGTSLSIQYNDVLMDISALYGLSLVGQDVTISNNITLPTQNAWDLVNQIETIGGTTTVSGNN